MKSTMMDSPLTIARILEHGRQWHAAREVVTEIEHGPRRRASFAAVAARAARLANGLSALGVSGDQRVATYMWNNQEHLEAYLAVPAMGAVLHPVNIRLSPEQVAYTIDVAEDAVVIVDESLAPDLARLLPDLPTIRAVVVNGTVDRDLFARSGCEVVSYEALIADSGAERTWADVDERDAAILCFTTGTTGNPKGVAYSHRSIALQSLASATANALRIGAEDRILIAVPMFHATAWCYPYSGFWFGADMVMLDRFLKPESIVGAIEQERVTFANGVPTIWNDVLALLRAEPGHDLSSLRCIVVGGAAVPRSLMAAFDAEVGVPIFQGWGLTETSPLVAVARPPAGATPADADAARLSQGRVLAGVEIRIVDPDTLADLPADGNTIGELELRGPWVTGSYLKDDGTDKFHDGWLRTGDIGTLDPSGYVRLTDRTKDVIKSGGEWISSVALEEALLAHPGITEAAVIGVPDQHWGERPCALVVAASGESLEPEAIYAWLQERVPRWWIPEYWVRVGALPRTSVGKLDKKLLRSRHTVGELDVIVVGK
ncbi:long-chain fatty acid--CoA ligase (plasmid) [Rhodococcus oxybenzonivorans]|uniref:Long-chain fatty acid--CoA ligase n=1 Tax=Rhodococcus oxybenzonivorans TaxID=1990687 RepID=A0A2S2C604_9NOCA|nr:long-chain fatty acid--CoA ligase [Rhodococcus oxybenzonivorans]AWK76272.1 long-chain fatty acid--CoA ligase [Rhodococcus oxybenzonivorans]